MSKWIKRFKSIGGNSSINTRGGCVSYPTAGTYVFRSNSDFNFFKCVVDNQMDVGLPCTIDQIHLYGMPCSDNYEHHTIIILLEKKTGHMFGFPMFTETTLALSPILREYKNVFAVTYGTYIKKPVITLTRWIRFTRMGDGITGIFELIGDSWNPISYLWDKEAEIKKIELTISDRADLVHTCGPNSEDWWEFNVDAELVHNLLLDCIFTRTKKQETK